VCWRCCENGGGEGWQQLGVWKGCGIGQDQVWL